MEKTQTEKNIGKILTGQWCPYCNCRTEKVTDKDIYGPQSNYDRYFYRCVKNPDHYVGIRKSDNETSMGRVADKNLRYWKRKGHEAFDPIWKDLKIFSTQHGAYVWLSGKMNLPLNVTHFGMFDVEQCKTAIEHCEKLKKHWIKVTEEENRWKAAPRKEEKIPLWAKPIILILIVLDTIFMNKYVFALRMMGYRGSGGMYEKKSGSGYTLVRFMNGGVHIKEYGGGYGESEFMKAPYTLKKFKSFIRSNQL
jgi:hypothetical protein